MSRKFAVIFFLQQFYSRHRFRQIRTASILLQSVGFRRINRSVRGRIAVKGMSSAAFFLQLLSERTAPRAWLISPCPWSSAFSFRGKPPEGRSLRNLSDTSFWRSVRQNLVFGMCSCAFQKTLGFTFLLFPLRQPIPAFGANCRDCRKNSLRASCDSRRHR